MPPSSGVSKDGSYEAPTARSGFQKPPPLRFPVVLWTVTAYWERSGIGKSRSAFNASRALAA
jgi:hypothetical protein